MDPMVKTALVVLVLVAAVSIPAETPTLPATDVTHTDILAFIQALPPNAVSDKPIRVVDAGGYRIGVYGVLRPKSVVQESNLHETKGSEIYYILEGSATLVTGGTIPNAHPLSPGSNTMQGARIEGGGTRRVAK